MLEKNNYKLITCILPKGVAMGVVRDLKTEKGIITANVDSARGMGKLTPLAYRGVGEQTEKEILNVVVRADLSDELFEYIYHVANINRPHGGLIYLCKLQQATAYSLPDLPDEE